MSTHTKVRISKLVTPVTLAYSEPCIQHIINIITIVYTEYRGINI